jgi:hypothetical protein
MDKEIDFPDYVDTDDMDINCKEWELSGLKVVQHDAPVDGAFPTARIQTLKVLNPEQVDEAERAYYDKQYYFEHVLQPLATYERQVDHFNGEYEDWRKI